MPKTKKAPDPIDVHVGGMVRNRRELLGISQEKLGETVGVTFQQIQKYESGANRMSASRLCKIAMALNCVPGFFFEGLPLSDTASKNTAPVEVKLLSIPGAADLLRAYSSSSTAGRKSLRDIANAVAA